jgi:hypothetical protein
MVEITPDVPPPFETITQKCLRKNPDDRPQTMREVQIELSALKRDSDSGSLYNFRIPESALSSPSGIRKPEAGESGKVSPGNRKFYWRVAVLAVLSIALLVEIGLWLRGSKQPATAVSNAAVPTEDIETAASGAPTPAAPPPTLPAADKLTNDVVISLVSERIPTSLILSHIRAAKTTSFDLSTEQLIRLNKAGVPAMVIDQMRDPRRTDLAMPAEAAAKLDAKPALEKNIETAYVALPDGMPIKIALKDAIPMDVAMGRPVLFTLQEDFKFQEILVCSKGSIVHGEITEMPSKKGLFGIGSEKLSFAVSKAETLGGDFINVRAKPSARADGPAQKQVEIPSKRPDKEIALPAGTEYTVYVDGPQNVKVPKK